MLLLRAGNEIIHMLTRQIGKRQVLRVDMEDWEGNKGWAEYDNFVVDSERKGYKLKSVGKYTGNAGLYGLKNYNRSTKQSIVYYCEMEFIRRHFVTMNGHEMTNHIIT